MHQSCYNQGKYCKEKIPFTNIPYKEVGEEQYQEEGDSQLTELPKSILKILKL